MEIFDILREHPLLGDLSDDSIKGLAACAKPVRFAPGSFVFREGDEANRFWVITRGMVSVELGTTAGTRVVQTLRRPSLLGFSWLFSPYLWMFDGHCPDEVEAIEFDGAAVRAACKADHQLGYEVMEAFAATVVSRLQATRLQLLDVYAH